MRLANAAQSNQANDLQPPVHVDIMNALTIHGFWAMALYDWTKRASGQVRANKYSAEVTICIPMPTSSYNPEQKSGRPQGQKGRLRMRVV
jgi:hypothetical protein